MQVTPYVLFEPYVQIGFGRLLYGRATLQIEPGLVFALGAHVHQEDNFRWTWNTLDLHLKIPLSLQFTAGYDLSIPLISIKDEWKSEPFELVELEYELVSKYFNVRRVQLSSNGVAQIASESSLVPGSKVSSATRLLLQAPEPASPDSDALCACPSINITIPWRSDVSNGTTSTLTKSWQVVNGSLIDTCSVSTDNIDSASLMFTVPQTGYYHIVATVADISPDSQSASWSAFARIGPGCCGRFVFCASIRALRPTWTGTMFLYAGDSLSFVWASDAAGSEATITTSIILDTDPDVYVDLLRGRDNNDGSRFRPAQTLEGGLRILATKVTPSTSAVFLILNPTLPAYDEMFPGRSVPQRIPTSVYILLHI